MTLFLNSNTPKSLEFNWDGTRLGIRVEGDAEFTYVDLQGPPGIQGFPGDPATNLVTSVAGRAGDIALTPKDVGLEKVRNVDLTDASNITSGELRIDLIPDILYRNSRELQTTLYANRLNIGRSGDNAIEGTVYFHSGERQVSFDARVVCTGGNPSGYNGGGTLNYYAAMFRFSGSIAFTSGVSSTSTTTGTLVIGNQIGLGGGSGYFQHDLYVQGNKRVASEEFSSDAENLTSGTVPAERLPDEVLYSNKQQTITQTQTFTTQQKVKNPGGNCFRFISPDNSHGVIVRIDNNIFWLLNTDEGDAEGSWNEQRPFYMALNTGNVFSKSQVSLEEQTVSTSPTTGALRLPGIGLGGGNIYLVGSLYVNENQKVAATRKQSWIPKLTTLNGSTEPTYQVAKAYYWVNGNCCFINVRFTFDNSVNPFSSDGILTCNLPVDRDPSFGLAEYEYLKPFSWNCLSGIDDLAVGVTSHSPGYIRFFKRINGQVYPVKGSDFNGTGYFRFSGHYPILPN